MELSGKEVSERKVSVQVAKKPGTASSKREAYNNHSDEQQQEDGEHQQQGGRRGGRNSRRGRGRGGRVSTQSFNLSSVRLLTGIIGSRW